MNKARRALATGVVGAMALAAACSSSGTDTASPTPDEGSATTVSSGTLVARGTSTAGADVAVPEVARLEGGKGEPFAAMPAALADEHGYVEEEFVLSGDATSYDEGGPWGTDGRWTATPAETAPYTTRILVRRPADPAAFDGTVLVEWLNVSSGQETDVDFGHLNPELLDHGTVWVGVSAQKAGVEGGGAAFDIPGVDPVPLVEWDPERYGELRHPGDDYSYDILSQVAAALRRPGAVDPLGGLEPEQIIAAGESQSGARLATYINAVHPLAQIYDGYLVHSRSDGGSALDTDTPVAPPLYANIRTDLDVPVLQFVTETDLFGLPFIEARQPDNDHLRTWEVAGTAHLDRGMLDYRYAVAGLDAAPDPDPIVERCGRINEGPQGPVLRAAFSALRRWVAGGEPPAEAPPIEVAGDAVARDELGIALGGIRTPDVDAPTVVLRGDNLTSTDYVCALFGSTAELDPAAVEARFPTDAAYDDAKRSSLEAAVEAGYLLAADAPQD